MAANGGQGGYGITLFRPGISTGAKIRGIIFFIIFCLIIAVMACYWLFANSVEPIVLGMPYGMFFITLFITIEFVVLIFLYFLEPGVSSPGVSSPKGPDNQGGE